MHSKYRKALYFFPLILALVCLSIYIYKNIPLRTAIFRSCAQGNNYLISENDTLYSFGYYGIQKWLVDDNGEMKLLAENEDFVENRFCGRLMARSGVINDSIIYVVSRSYLAGPDTLTESDYLNGKITIMRKKDLSVVREINSDIKLIEAKKYKNKLIISGLKGFDIYDISNSTNIKAIYKYRQRDFTEFQGLEIFEQRDSLYIVFARFAEGISVWNITNCQEPYILQNISIKSIKNKGVCLPEGLQIFRVALKYPYLYATVAPMSSYFETSKDRRGVIVFDISDLNDIKSHVSLIPPKYNYKTLIGDCEPTHLSLYKNKLYVNYGEKGVAVFDIRHPFNPNFENVIDVANDGNMILPIHINHRGIIFSGDYYWSDIYAKQLR